MLDQIAINADIGRNDFTITWNATIPADAAWSSVSQVEWEELVISDPVTGVILDRVNLKELQYQRLIDLCNTPCWRYKA